MQPGKFENTVYPEQALPSAGVWGWGGGWEGQSDLDLQYLLVDLITDI